MIIKPFRLIKIDKYIKNKSCVILDAGAGSHSASITKKWFPNCTYHGIDISDNYRNDDKDFSLMDKFYKLDLTSLELSNIPDNFYDVIIMSHIIEHLENGDAVIEKILTKLKPAGLIYIEFPSIKSTKLPSMPETLNFYDDPTHCRIFLLPEVYDILINNGLKINEGGTRRQWINIFLMPVKIVRDLVKTGRLNGGTFWDITGFAEYVVAHKIKHDKN